MNNTYNIYLLAFAPSFSAACMKQSLRCRAIYRPAAPEAASISGIRALTVGLCTTTRVLLTTIREKRHAD